MDLGGAEGAEVPQKGRHAARSALLTHSRQAMEGLRKSCHLVTSQSSRVHPSVMLLVPEHTAHRCVQCADGAVRGPHCSVHFVSLQSMCICVRKICILSERVALSRVEGV